MEKHYKIKDESGDRKYFTQIPNMIVNHSTAYEQSLYLIMKRIAGEQGTCFASQNYLAEKMGVDKKTVAKNITKLLKRKWIAEIAPIKVRGGSVRQFVIVDLWKINLSEYEVVVKRTGLKVEGLFPEVDVKGTSGGGKRDTKKNKEEEYKKNGQFLKRNDETTTRGGGLEKIGSPNPAPKEGSPEWVKMYCQ